jgi:hypothetical protein
MEALKRNEAGIFCDDRYEKIEKDIQNAILPVLEKWKDVDTDDIELVMIHTLPFFMLMNHRNREMQRLFKEKGYKSSDEFKTR